MEVIFQRTGQRRYRVEVRRPELPAVEMNPAPGYDDLVPHDMMHLVVESQLGLERGIFGQLAAGGGTFHVIPERSTTVREAARQRRRMNQRGEKMMRDGRADCERSEAAVYVCWQEWLARSNSNGARRVAQTTSDQATTPVSKTPSLPNLSQDKLKQIFHHLDELSLYWSRLNIGDSMKVHWPDLSVSPVDSTM
jgi:hypothetical protein